MWFGFGDQSVVDSNDVLENYGDGIYCKEGSTPIINWNNICGNTGYGVRNVDASVTVNAELNWWDHLSGPGGAGPGTGNGVSTYVDYDPWLQGPVPVELTSFTATCIAGEVILSWITATETNNCGFEIERKLINNDGSGYWTVRGFKQGFGTTTDPQEYSFVDDITGVNAVSIAYRLKQIDFDGSFEYSEEVLVTQIIPTEFMLEQNYPNPFNPTTSISYSLPVKSVVNLKVYDAIGKEVAVLVNQEQGAGRYNLLFNATGLASGIYFYQLKTNEFTAVKKLVLMK